MKTIKKIAVVAVAALVALICPFFLCRVIYPLFQIFLPEGRIILTPLLRIIATLLMSVIDYLIAGFILVKWCPEWFRTYKWHLLTGGLTLLWSIFIAVIWYIVVTD